MATTISLSSATFFSGLIRARGDEGGETTTEVFETTFTTAHATTEFYATTIGTTNGTVETTIDPFETTVIPTETTAETIVTTSAPRYKLATDRVGTSSGYSQDLSSYTVMSRRGISYSAKIKYWTTPPLGEGTDVRVDFCPEFYEIGSGNPLGAGVGVNVGINPDPSATFDDGTKSFHRCVLPDVYSPAVSVGALGNPVIYSMNNEASERIKLSGIPFPSPWILGTVPPWLSAIHSVPSGNVYVSYDCCVMAKTSATKTEIVESGLVVGADIIVELSLYIQDRLVYQDENFLTLYESGMLPYAPGLAEDFGFTTRSVPE